MSQRMSYENQCYLLPQLHVLSDIFQIHVFYITGETTQNQNYVT